jgi:protein phosphatase 1L
MEDRWAASQLTSSGPAVFGIFDGHGGAKVAAALAEALPGALLAALRARGQADAAETIHACFLEADAECVREDLSGAARTCRVPGPGSTAAVAVLFEDAVWLANVGDARAVLADESGALLAETLDQTPNVPEECARVVALGGTVSRGAFDRKLRAGGVLAISRAFGNAGLKDFIKAEPAVVRVPLPPGGCTLLIGSDGLYDVISSAEAVRNLHGRLRAPAATLAMRARAHERAGDNITALVLRIGPAAPAEEATTQPVIATQPPEVAAGGTPVLVRSPAAPAVAAAPAPKQQSSKRKLSALLLPPALLPAAPALPA